MNEKCAVCEGRVYLADQSSCKFCNESGIENGAGKAFMAHHICNCIQTDRETCGICHKPCHHDTSLGPKNRYGKPTNSGKPPMYRIRETVIIEEGYV